MFRQYSKTSVRRGSAAVEFAVVAPLLFLMLLAVIEFSRAAMVLHCLEDAANQGCRVAIAELGNEAAVGEAIESVVDQIAPKNYTWNISPSTYPDVGQWEPVTVTVAVDYKDVSWIPMPVWLGEISIEGAATLPRETGQFSAESSWLGDTKVN